MMTADSRQRGKWGEDIAYQYFAEHGYGIMEQNWRMGHYEIDLIAQKGETIVFVEVKTRKVGDADPVTAVDKRKRSRMVSSADVYMHKYNIPFEYRFDIFAITGDEADYTVEHIPDAFVPPLKRHNFSFRL